MGERLSIVTSKPQTTRRRTLGIFTDEGHQAVFVDTPGLLDPRYLLQRSMRAEAIGALEGADVVVAVVDAGFPDSVVWAAEQELPIEAHKILCINKIDRISESGLAALLARFATGGWEAVVPTVASTGAGIDDLRGAILERLPESPPFYPEDELSDAPVREFVAELIRETCFEELSQEVPYSIAVRVEEFKDRGPEHPLYIEATVFVERDSQKGIVIGSGGRMIRGIGTRARAKAEEFLCRRVFLELRVKVLPNWRKQHKYLRVLGFSLPPEDA